MSGTNRLDEGDYVQVQQTIGMMAMIVSDLPLDEFINTASYANAVGPILDPTLWICGHDKLHGILDMAVALRKFQTAAQAFIAAHGEAAE